MFQEALKRERVLCTKLCEGVSVSNTDTDAVLSSFGWLLVELRTSKIKNITSMLLDFPSVSYHFLIRYLLQSDFTT